MDRHPAPRIGKWLIAAVLLTLGLSFSLARWTGGRRTPSPPEWTAPERALVGPPLLVGGSRNQEAPPPKRADGDPAARPLRVHVLDAATRTGLPGAHVEVHQGAPVARLPGAILATSVSSRGTTDGDGVFEYAARSASEGLYIVCRHEGMAATGVSLLPPFPANVEVPLAGGVSLRGRAIDGANRPVAGLTLTARRVSVPGTAGDDLVLLDGAPLHTTGSNADGGFAFDGLAPGRYRIEVEDDDGWRVIGSDEDPLTPDPATRAFIAPTDEATVHLQRVLLVRIQCVDARSGEAIHSIPHVVWRPREGSPRTLLSPNTSLQLRSGLTLPRAEMEGAILVGWVDVTGAVLDAEGTIAVTVGTPGYRVAATSLHLLTPAEYRRSKTVDRIRMTKERELATGRIRLQPSIVPPHVSLPEMRTLRVTIPWANGHAPFAIPGVPQADGTWLFDGIPEGTHGVFITGPPSAGGPSIRIRAGEEALIDGAAWDRGFLTLSAIDGNGSRVFDLDWLILQPIDPPGPRRLLPARKATGFRIDGKQEVIELAPGRYDVSAWTAGYEAATEHIEVTGDAFVSVTLKLIEVDR